MSAIFLLPVCLTYWTRQYTTCVDPHVDNSHQVWTWYDHPLPSYSVLSADTSRDLVTLTFDLLTLNSCRTWRITRLTLPTSCLLTIQLLLGYDNYGSFTPEPFNLKAVFGRKNLCSIEIRLKNGSFWGKLGPNLRCWFRDPQKALPCA